MIYKYMVKIIAFFYMLYRIIHFRFKKVEDYDDWDKHFAKQLNEAKMKKMVKK